MRETGRAALGTDSDAVVAVVDEAVVNPNVRRAQVRIDAIGVVRLSQLAVVRVGVPWVAAKGRGQRKREHAGGNGVEEHSAILNQHQQNLPVRRNVDVGEFGAGHAVEMHVERRRVEQRDSAHAKVGPVLHHHELWTVVDLPLVELVPWFAIYEPTARQVRACELL